MNGTTKWEYSTFRDMQNRIRLLEMDNELMKSQMLSYSHDIRQAFMDMADRIDRMETKLTHLIQFDKTHTPSIMLPTFHIPQVENAEGLEHVNGFDAMSCVETVMESCADLRQTMLGGGDEGKKISEAVLKSLENIHGTSRTRAMEADSNHSSSLHQKNYMLEGEVGRRRYDCTVCGKTFSQSSGLSRHHKIHIRRQQDIQNGINSERFTKPKRFFCNFPGCQSSFTSRSGMTKHTKHFHRENRAHSMSASGSGLLSFSRHSQASVATGSGNSNTMIKLPQVQAGLRICNNNNKANIQTDDSATMSDDGTSQENSPSRDTMSDDDDLDESPFTHIGVPTRV